MQKIHEKIKKILESKIIVGILYGVGGVLVALFIFAAGVDVGFDKASFGRNWGDNYERNFGMMGRNGLGGIMGHFPNAHGAVGKIIKVELPTIIVQDKDNTEKVILIKDDTKIQNGTKENSNINDLQLDGYIIVIGSPNTQGQIEAKFIRILPSPDFINNSTLNTNATQ